MGRKTRSRKTERDVSTSHSIARSPARVFRPLGGVTPLAFIRSDDPGPDGRLFHPSPDFRPAFTLGGRKASVGLADRPSQRARLAKRGIYPRPGFSQTKGVLTFEAPARVSVCVRRQRRKEVLHAFRKAGRGGSQRKRRRSQWSHVSCR